MSALILLAPNLGDFFFTTDQVGLARATLNAGDYKATIVESDLEGEECAEEMFDLTNNPSRQDERIEKYGTLRSVSVGDIVISGKDMFLCMSCGWEKL